MVSSINMKITLIRHGESAHDTENRYGGSYNDSLTDKGRHQAKEVSERLSRKGIEVVYSSTLNRAKETAEIIAKKLDRSVQQVESFRERNFYGVLTGMKRDDAAVKFPKEVALVGSYKNTIKGGEDYESFRSRVLFSFENIARSGHKSVAIVTHGGPISCIVREVLKLGEFKRIGDCAFLEISYDGKYKLGIMDNAEIA